jgi:chloramphenicol 3-O-phosphotransferase
MQLVIISGPPSAGKSATAEALCLRYDRMLHIDVEALRGFLRMGRLRPGDSSPEGERQRALFIAAACDMARRFIDAGYGVVIDDVVTQDELPLFREGLAGSGATAHFVVLLPKLEELLPRRAAPPERIRELHRRFAEWESVATIDPEDLAPELVADRVMALAAEGRALLDL